MIIIVGPQKTGKTVFCQMVYEPLGELAAEASLQDLLDHRQTDLPGYFILFTDEMAFADRTDPANLKTFMTGNTPSRRPMRMSTAERIHINATLLGTANHSLDKVIYDSSGMRRFVEITPRPLAEIRPNWHHIEAFDWAGLWQIIDPYAADPLVSQFEDRLLNKQEAIRNMDNSEYWLRKDFDHRQHVVSRRSETSSVDASEWFAQQLYEIFRDFEARYDPGYRGTSLQRWGRDMRSLIDHGAVEGWSYKPVGHKTAYRIEHPQVRQSAVVPFERPGKANRVR